MSISQRGPRGRGGGEGTQVSVVSGVCLVGANYERLSVGVFLDILELIKVIDLRPKAQDCVEGRREKDAPHHFYAVQPTESNHGKT